MKQNQPHRNKRYEPGKNLRPTIGVLIHTLVTFHELQWLGVADGARAQGANVICFDGADLRSPNNFEAQANAIYELVDPARIDGLIIWSAGLGVFVDPKELTNFCKHYHPLPVISVEQQLEGIPSVLMDDYKGMYAAVSHLIEVHNYRRIAFISGAKNHVGAQERYRAYAEALTNHGLPLDPSLVTLPTEGWDTPENLAGIDRWLSERKANFEAVVTVNDLFALYALNSLQANGVRVPNDVALASFDDDVGRRPLTPPLTTVRPPFYEMGWRATEMVLAQLRGEEIPAQVSLPTELIVRRSCGCLSPTIVQAAVGTVETITLQGGSESFETALAAEREQLVLELEQTIPTNKADWAAQLLDGLVADLSGQTAGQFLSTVDHLLSQTVVATGGVGHWHHTLSLLRRHVLPLLSDPAVAWRAEDLWQQARTLIAETAQWAEVHQKLQTQQLAEAFRRLGQALITTFDVTELMDVIIRELHPLGIQQCYLALYENPQIPTHQARLILAYDQHGRIELPPQDQLFPARHLLPTPLWQPDQPINLMAQPLYFKEQQLGFVLFEANSRQGWIYEALRGQLSSALQGALLVEREKQALVEVQLSRQQAEAALAEALAAQRHSQKLATELATVAEVSIATATFLETTQLLQTVVDLTKTSFDLYHVHIYLLNQTGDSLDLAAGAGQVGQQMLAQGWHIPLDREQSLVAHAARTSQGIIINDVRSAPDFFPNPLLPDTRAEMAVPMIVGNTVVGVLDMQAAEPNRFSQEDAHIQTILAGQVAVALQNARLYRETQTRAEQERLIRTITDKVHRGASREAILQVTLTELGQLLHASKAVARLGTPSQLLAHKNNGASNQE